MCECTYSQYRAYPDLTINIDGHNYTMTRENYIERDSGLCLFKIMYMDISYTRPFWILGLTFFHNYYTVFDQENLRVGFAESTLSNLPETPRLSSHHSGGDAKKSTS